MKDVLQRTVALIEQAPTSANSLTLYALINTMDYENAGCLFKLNKLRDVDVETRKLAYELMELMIRHGNKDEEWKIVKQKIDGLIRSA